MPPPMGTLQPHRGVLILVLGILGLVVCVVCGIVAWVLANSDLEAIRSGRMDPAGEGLTVAGRICGMISVALAVIGLIVWIVFMVVGFSAARMSG